MGNCPQKHQHLRTSYSGCPWDSLLAQAQQATRLGRVSLQQAGRHRSIQLCANWPDTIRHHHARRINKVRQSAWDWGILLWTRLLLRHEPLLWVCVWEGQTILSVSKETYTGWLANFLQFMVVANHYIIMTRCNHASVVTNRYIICAGCKCCKVIAYRERQNA